jgi:hypothetical protein
MIEPLLPKIRRLIYGLVCKITGHEYGCCDKVFKQCKKCLGETE